MCAVFSSHYTDSTTLCTVFVVNMYVRSGILCTRMYCIMYFYLVELARADELDIYFLEADSIDVHQLQKGRLAPTQSTKKLLLMYTFKTQRPLSMYFTILLYVRARISWHTWGFSQKNLVQFGKNRGSSKWRNFTFYFFQEITFFGSKVTICRSGSINELFDVQHCLALSFLSIKFKCGCVNVGFG
jgi:hypothetical protein